MLTQHPLRQTIISEIHARPYALVPTPARVSFLALILDDETAETVRDHIATLCQQSSVARPAPDSMHHLAEIGPLTVRWEQHTEFYSISVTEAVDFEDPFGQPPIDRLDREWVERLPGRVISATHVAVESSEMPERGLEYVTKRLTDSQLVGSTIVNGGARYWTDYDIHPDGFGRILVRNISLSPRQMGRILRRLLEIETYQAMAMLAFPAAKAALPTVAAAERALGNIARQLADAANDPTVERRLLDDLSRLSAQVELSVSETAFRVSAAQAYDTLVARRIEELREERLLGLQMAGDFLYRRLAPAMATVQSLAARQNELSHRIGQATDLLRTRINVNLEEQNQKLLQSMDTRANAQLRLQRTVEGLSVVAISYYAISLIVYGAEAAAAAGILTVSLAIVGGLALPVVAFAVWRVAVSVRRAVVGE